jgi:type II secretory pathway pseudopilin PulG
MKTTGAKTKYRGLTLIELIVVLAVIFVLAAGLLPSLSGSHRSSLIMCQSNQRFIAIGLSLFENDHAGNYPWQVSLTNGGSMESIPSKHVFPHVRALAPYYGNQLNILACPTDSARHLAANYSQISDQNISYFLNLDATTNSQAILSGERHLEANDRPVDSGLFSYSTNMILNWTRELHGKVQNGPIGGLSFPDDHVEFARMKELNSFFRNQLLATNTLVLP